MDVRGFIDFLSDTSNLLEGVSNLRKKYLDSGELEEDVWNELHGGDPSGNKKYLEWMIRQYLEGYDRLEHMVDVVKQFHLQVNRRRITGEESDIYGYSSIEEVETALEGTSKELTRSEKEKEEKKDAEKIYEDDDVVVIKPTSHAASKRYGANTKWCISGRSDTYWKQYYVVNGVTFYFVLPKKGREKWAIAVRDYGRYVGKDSYNAVDRTFPTGKIPGYSKFKHLIRPASKEEIEARRIEDMEQDLTRNPDGTVTWKGKFTFRFDNSDTEYPIYSLRYDRDVYIGVEDLPELPMRARKFREVVGRLEKAGVEWIQFRVIRKIPMVEFHSNAGLQAVGKYEDKYVIIETKVGVLQNSKGYMGRVAKKEDLPRAKGNSISLEIVTNSILKKLGLDAEKYGYKVRSDWFKPKAEREKKWTLAQKKRRKRYEELVRLASQE